MRFLVHIGLAILLVIAPTLCCCSVRTALARVAAPSPPRLPTSSTPPAKSGPVEASCCQATPVAHPVAKSCCHTELAAKNHIPAPKPTAPPPSKCVCCVKQPDATPPQLATVPATLLPGDFVPVELLALVAIPPEHLGLLGGLDPPEHAGVDTRSEALFARHVMRC